VTVHFFTRRKGFATTLKPHQQLRLAAYLADHPVMDVIYRFKQRPCYLLLKKHRTRRQCEQLIPRLLGETLASWQDDIGTMWRFTRNNGITESFHNKMETLTR
jgi:hypothetical protein